MSMKIWINKNKRQRIRNKKYTKKQQALLDTCTGVYLKIKSHEKIRRAVIDRIIERHFEECFIPCDGRAIKREDAPLLFEYAPYGFLV